MDKQQDAVNNGVNNTIIFLLTKGITKDLWDAEDRISMESWPLQRARYISMAMDAIRTAYPSAGIVRDVGNGEYLTFVACAVEDPTSEDSQYDAAVKEGYIIEHLDGLLTSVYDKWEEGIY